MSKGFRNALAERLFLCVFLAKPSVAADTSMLATSVLI